MKGTPKLKRRVPGPNRPAKEKNCDEAFSTESVQGRLFYFDWCSRKGQKRRLYNLGAANLHVVEELFVNDLAIGDFVDTDLFQLEAPALRLERDVHFESNGEMRAGDEGAFDSG